MLLDFFCRTPRGCVDWNCRFYCSWILLAASHPSWVRGLKWKYGVLKQIGRECRTPRGCVDWNGSKTFAPLYVVCRTPRGCVDWNFSRRLLKDLLTGSHPSWVRGLKCFYLAHPLAAVTVAPLVGAWIEITCRRYNSIIISMSHPSWVRGLKLYELPKRLRYKSCRTPRGCVDWNGLIFCRWRRQ